jgi:hypothetical protein
MASPSSSLDEIADRARALYESQIRPRVDAGDRGKYLIIEVNSGDYEIDDDDLAASDRAAAKHPNGEFFAMRIGYPALGRIGFRGTGAT